MEKKINKIAFSVASNKTKTKVKVNKRVLEKEIMFVTIISSIFILISSFSYIIPYSNSLIKNFQIAEVKKEIAILNMDIQSLERENDQKLNYKSIEEQAKIQGMQYVDNLSYIK